MHFAYQDRDNLYSFYKIYKILDLLYLVMDLLPGGDLRYHIGR